MCYAGLWHISGNQPPTESQPSSIEDAASEGGADYSILAIAGAMYLMISIAAADLWGGCALCWEGHDSGGEWFWERKVFGVGLLGTFVALIGASIRVLFYSSFENVELVIGAAAVLFIADVVSGYSFGIPSECMSPRCQVFPEFMLLCLRDSRLLIRQRDNVTYVDGLNFRSVQPPFGAG